MTFVFGITGATHPPHWPITHASLSLPTLITKFGRVMEGILIMHNRRIRWETMDKGDIQHSKLAEHYLITCRTEGKTASTLRGYREKLERFVLWADRARLGEFSVELAREYISYLQSVPKYEDDPRRSPNGELMSAANVQNHVRRAEDRRLLKLGSSPLNRHRVSTR